MDSKRVCYESIVIKTVSIPVAFLHAQMLAMVVSQATSGNVEGVVRYAFILIILVVLYALFQKAFWKIRPISCSEQIMES